MDLNVIFLAIGFAFVIEGLVWGLFPRQIIAMVLELAKINVNHLRWIGIGSLAFGVGLIALVVT